MKLILANPRGFCAGVVRAIDIVERAIERLGAPIYVRHEVVHNTYEVNRLKKLGAIFTDDINEIPENETVIFSAHGVSQAIRTQAKQRKLTVFDATCPLVTKVHMEVARCAKHNTECILIGHAGHPEVEGTMGQYNNPKAGIYLVETEADVAQLSLKNPQRCSYVSQTTLSVDDTSRIIAALRQRFPKISGPKKEDICYATQNRQDAVKQLCEQCTIVLVVGSNNSSNSNRLKELAERLGKRAYLIDDASYLSKNWFTADDVIGVTAGASAPELLVNNVILQLKDWGATGPDSMPGIEENIVFALPKELRRVN